MHAGAAWLRALRGINCSAVVETLFESGCSATCAAPSPAPSTTRPACSSRPAAEPFSGRGSAGCDERAGQAVRVRRGGYRVGAVDPRRVDVHVPQPACGRSGRGRFEATLSPSERRGDRCRPFAPDARRAYLRICAPCQTGWAGIYGVPAAERAARRLARQRPRLTSSKRLPFWPTVLTSPTATCGSPQAGQASPAADLGVRSDDPRPARADDASLADVSRDHVRRVLERAGGNKKHAAETLGVSRRAFYRLLDRLNLQGNIRKRT